MIAHRTLTAKNWAFIRSSRHGLGLAGEDTGLHHSLTEPWWRGQQTPPPPHRPCEGKGLWCHLCDPPDQQLLGGSEWREREMETHPGLHRQGDESSFLLGVSEIPTGEPRPLQGPACKHKPTKQSSFALAEGESRSREVPLSSRHKAATVHTGQHSSGQAEDPLVRIKALVTDLTDIWPPAPWGSFPTSLPRRSHMPRLFPCWAMMGRGVGLEGRWCMVRLEHRAGRRHSGRELGI